MSVAVLPGVALVVGGTPAGMRTGIAVGAVSALLAAIFSTLNKRTIGSSPALTVTGLEMAAGALLLPPLAWLLPAADASSCSRACTMVRCSSRWHWHARCFRTRWRWSRCAT
jgi:drug/metabolite transporter (DMT)-like permease